METTLRLVWPQWQGAGLATNTELTPDLDPDDRRRAYAVGTRILDALLPVAEGPVERIPVPDTDDITVTNGIENRLVLVQQLDAALAAITRHDPVRILTIGGDCAVSVAPFAALAARYPDDMAVVWIDSHPDVGTPESAYPGYHAMALSHLLGHGDTDILQRLPAVIPASRVALAGLHAWTDDDYPNIEKWGINVFPPDSLRASSEPLLEWLAATGCGKVAIHFDVDVVDADDLLLGLGADRGGLTLAQASRVAKDIGTVADVVALTVAEYIPRQVIRLQRALQGMPLIG